MACRIIVDDQINPPVVIEGVPTQAVTYSRVSGGGAILRFLDGSAERQDRWYKEAITVTGTGRAPQGLRDLEYGQGNLSLQIETGLGIDNYTVVSLGPSEDWSITGGEVSWTLVMEEA